MVIEKLERAQAQTWWLPSSAERHEGPDHCFYRFGARFHIVRFTPPEPDIDRRLSEILQVVGSEPAMFTFFPHRHGPSVLEALRGAGFWPAHRHEARAAHVDRYRRVPPADIRVVMVETLEDMQQVYAVRSGAFGSRPDETEEDLRRFLADATGPEARVRQFLAVDAHSGAPLSQAGMSLYPELGVAFLFAGGTLEAARGRGAYTALVAARVAHARARGIEHVGLFAREESSAPIVARQGFELCGAMHYWSLNGA